MIWEILHFYAPDADNNEESREISREKLVARLLSKANVLEFSIRKNDEDVKFASIYFLGIVLGTE